MNQYYVYFLTNWNNRVLYIGVTGDLRRRVAEHKQGFLKGFTQKYHVDKLVYYECFHDIRYAIAREKQLKRWSRVKKNVLVQSVNPDWRELAFDL